MTRNIIQFPAASGAEPYFAWDYPLAAKWGGVAQPIGHEFIHGFDTTGSHYNKNGEVKNWWSDEARKLFKKRVDCLVKQYGDLEHVETNYEIDFDATIDDNIADVIGIDLAHEAFKETIGNDLDKVEIASLQLTNQQMFFVTAALGHCDISFSDFNVDNSEGKKDDEHFSVPDDHASAKHRIWGMMMNSEDFARAFQCPRGSRMNPVTKCRIW